MNRPDTVRPPKTLFAGFLLAASLALCACERSDGSHDPLGLPEFPAEKTAADFPGMSYPSHAGAIPLPCKSGGPVWIVGVDGATWELARPMMERGELPNLARLVAEGAHGVLTSEEPTISPAVWATVATGMPRVEHGIVNFLVRRPGSYATTSSGPRDRRSPALWELVGAAGGRSTVLGWFGSYPAERIPGIYLSKGFDPADIRKKQIHPQSFVDALRAAPVEVRRQDQDEIGRTEFLSKSLREDARTMAALRAAVARERSDLVVVYLSGIDVVQHVTWRHMDPASQAFPQDGPADPGLSGVIPAYYRFIDHSLGAIVELAPQDATIVVLSDHGAGPLQPINAYHFQLAVLLERLGLMQEDRGEAFAIDETYRHDKRIWLNVAGTHPGGTVEPGDAPRRADEIAARLEAMRTDGGSPVFAAVTVHAGNPAWDPRQPALTVRFSSQALLASRVHDGDQSIEFDPVRLRHSDVSGEHRLDGLLVLRGPEVRPGRLPSPANLYQIAPTVLYLLGLPQDRRMMRHAPAEGGVLEAAIDPATLASRSITMVAEYPGTDRTQLLRVAATDDAGEDEPDPDREETLEKLRTLGYIR